MSTRPEAALEEQIALWRSYLRHRQAIHPVDVAELEDHLREQVATLLEAGSAPTRRSWWQSSAWATWTRSRASSPASTRTDSGSSSSSPRVPVSPSGGSHGRLVAFGLGGGGGRRHQGTRALRPRLGDDGGLLRPQPQPLRAAAADGLLRLEAATRHRTVRRLAVAFVVAAVFTNVIPSSRRLHARYSRRCTCRSRFGWWSASRTRPAAGDRSRAAWTSFGSPANCHLLRLIALGGGVLMAFIVIIFEAIGIDVEPYFESWVMPCGAARRILVAAWLVNAKQCHRKHGAVLTRLFTPLLRRPLLALPRDGAVDRTRSRRLARRTHRFDLLLVVVLGLLLYSVSARDPQSPPGAFDVLQIILVISALVADAIALWAIGAPITEFGFTPNRVAALGENVVLLVDLVWAAVLYIRFLRGRGPFTASSGGRPTTYPSTPSGRR